MAGRVVVALLATAALGVSGSAWASVEMPGFRLHSPGTAVVDEEIVVEVAAVDGASLYVHPLDRLVGLFPLEDLDEDLRPRRAADFIVVELRPARDGRFTGSVSAPVGDYALVPYPEVTGDLPAGGAYPDPALLSVVPPSSPPASGAPTGRLLAVAAALAVGVPVAVSRWIRRRRDIDDYFDRDFRDPPTLGGIWPGGGGGGGGGFG